MERPIMPPKKILSISLLICLALAASLSFAQDVSLKLTAFEGRVEVMIAPTQEWVDASIGQSLNLNDAIVTRSSRGQVPKWTKGADCKSVAIGFQGSNPCLPTRPCLRVPPALITCGGMFNPVSWFRV